MIALLQIGIVGRTGAGKSSLIATLFRLAEPSGSLKIDGVECLNLGLHDVRDKIAIICQVRCMSCDPTCLQWQTFICMHIGPSAVQWYCAIQLGPF